MPEKQIKGTATAWLYTDGGQWMQEWRDVRRIQSSGEDGVTLTLADEREVMIRGGILVVEENREPKA